GRAGGRGAPGLELPLHHLGDPDAARLRHGVGERLVEHLLEHAAGEAAIEEALLRSLDLRQHAAQEVGLQRLGGLRRVGNLAHRICSSARRAPAALRAWKMAARSRGLTPSVLSAAATPPTVAAPWTTCSLPPCSSTLTWLCGATTVWPVDSGPG